MRRIVRYRFLTIPNKVTGDIRLTIDNRGAEYSSTFDGGTSTNISLYPIISISIIRSSEKDESGNYVRAGWNPNDSIGMTKYTMPIFIRELNDINDGMKIPELYTYSGDKLELNDKVAEKIRKVFIIGNTTVELSAVVITTDDQQFEGIKIKFNNESSTVVLTINELYSLLYNLNNLDVDVMVMNMYKYFCKPSLRMNQSMKPEIDIIPPVSKNKRNVEPIKLDPADFKE